MKFSILFFFSILVAQICNAQRSYTLDDDQQYIDSVKATIQNTNSDSIKCISSFRLVDVYRRNRNTDSADFYSKIANQLKLKFPVLNAAAIFYNASAFFMKMDLETYEKELIKANLALKAYNNALSYEIRGALLKNLSILHQLKQDSKTAIKILTDEAIPIAKKGSDLEILSNVYKSLAIIFMNTNDRDKADQYLQLAISSIERAQQRSSTFNESKVELYVINAENKLELVKNPEAKISLDKAYKVLSNYPNSNLNCIYFYALGRYFHKLHLYNQAVKNYDKGISVCLKYNDIISLNRLKFGKYYSLYNLNKFSEARNLLIEIVEKKVQFNDDLRIYYKEIADASHKMGDEKTAYLYISKYMALKDSLYEVNTRIEINALESKFKNSENAKRISALEAQKERSDLIIKNARINYMLLSVIALSLLILLVFLYKNFKQQKTLTEVQAINHSQNLANLKAQKEVEVMQAMILSEELERARIARDLHDGIGSMLSALKLQSAELGLYSVEEKSVTSSGFNNLLDNSIAELRRVAYNLMPETLTRMGVEKALRDLCHGLSTNAVKIVFHANAISETIPSRNQVAIYRIVQELINNSLKHAQCSEILVDCSQNGDLFLISIEDNGKGFDTTQMNGFTGLGLKNMKSRVEMLNGQIDIKSNLEKGTIINIELQV